MPEIVTITKTIRPKWDSETIRNIVGAVASGVVGSLTGIAPIMIPNAPWWVSPASAVVSGILSILFGRRAINARMAVGDLSDKNNPLGYIRSEEQS